MGQRVVLEGILDLLGVVIGFVVLRNAIGEVLIMFADQVLRLLKLVRQTHSPTISA